METRELALFDFDGTLIPGDSIVAFVAYARKNGAMSGREYRTVLGQTAKYLLGGMTDAQIKTRSLRFLKDLSPEAREKLARGFVRSLLTRVYADGKKEIERHHRAGRLVMLVSASTENYMKHVCPALGADALVCTPVEADGTIQSNCKGEEKARRVTEWLASQGMEADWSRCYAYGDSKSDLPLLRLVGHPVQVNPKKSLRRAAPDMPSVKWK